MLLGSCFLVSKEAAQSMCGRDSYFYRLTQIVTAAQRDSIENERENLSDEIVLNFQKRTASVFDSFSMEILVTFASSQSSKDSSGNC